MTTSSTPVRMLQVGIGGFGRSWASEVVADSSDALLVGAVDLDPDALEAICTLTDLTPKQCFDNVPDALAAVDPDAVLITASVGAHIPVALVALAAGKHVLTEKPFAPTLEEARAAVDAAAARDLVLMVSQNYRYFPAVKAVEALVAGGEYGRVDAIYLDFRQYDNSAPYEDRKHYKFPEPMVVDMAIHHFDLMRTVLRREPLEVYCRSWNPPWSKFDEAAEAMAIVRFEDDIMVSYRGSWVSAAPPTPWAGEWHMELKDAEVNWTSRGGKPSTSADKVTVRRHGGKPRNLKLPIVEHTDRSGSLADFVRAIRTGNEPESSGRRNLDTLALTLAAVESSRTGAPVTLPPRNVELPEK